MIEEEGQDSLGILRQMTESFPKRFIVCPLEYVWGMIRSFRFLL